MTSFHIVHLYPDLLNLYGDRGNIMVMEKRCLWRGIEPIIHTVNGADPLDLSHADFVLLGGGSDKEQAIVAETLQKFRDELSRYVDQGGCLLAVCGGYQLLGNHYTSALGNLNGLGLFDFDTTNGSNHRCIGNIVIDSDLGFEVVGFENHGGLTILDGQHPFGKVRYGYGNDGTSQYEGIHEKNCIGTYIHGPLLPKNPKLADHFISTALKRKGINEPLKPLDDTMEQQAAALMIQRCAHDRKENPYITR